MQQWDTQGSCGTPFPRYPKKCFGYAVWMCIASNHHQCCITSNVIHFGNNFCSGVVGQLCSLTFARLHGSPHANFARHKVAILSMQGRLPQHAAQLNIRESRATDHFPGTITCSQRCERNRDADNTTGASGCIAMSNNLHFTDCGLCEIFDVFALHMGRPLPDPS